MGFTAFQRALRTRQYMVDWAKAEVERQGGLQELIQKLPELCSRYNKEMKPWGKEGFAAPFYNRRERSRLKRFFQEEEIPWPIPEAQHEYSHGWKGVFKGREKRAAERVERERLIRENMSKMPQMIEQYREERRNRTKNLPLIDQLILSPRMQKEKARRNRAVQQGGY